MAMEEKNKVRKPCAVSSACALSPLNNSLLLHWFDDSNGRCWRSSLSKFRSFDEIKHCAPMWKRVKLWTGAHEGEPVSVGKIAAT